MKAKGLLFTLISLFALQGQALGQIVPIGRLAFDGALERQIARQLSLQMRSQLKVLIPTAAENLHFNLFYPNETQINVLKQQYNTSILAAQDLTHELFPTVFYADVLSPQQINQSLTDIARVNSMLAQAEVFLEGQDIPLENAKQNMKNLTRYFSGLGSGQAVDLGNFDPERGPFPPQDRTYDEEEFFLSSPKGVAAPLVLPEKMKIAILNDDESILQSLLKMKQTQEGANWTVEGFMSPEEFLNRPDVRSYDLILTDLNLRPGGGVYLTLRLRQMGYQNTILAVSAYGRIPPFAKALYEHGIDGMYAAGTMASLRVPRIHVVVLDKIKNYFYYKEKGKWER